MKFVAPARSAVPASAFAHPVFAEYRLWRPLLQAPGWPALAQLNRMFDYPPALGLQAVAQTPELLADGLHYETRIAERCQLATREANWHDLLNALVWRRHPAIKWAMNRRQVADVAAVGPRQRTRGQCALTHFDEAGVLLVLRDPARLDAWDRHDWPGLFLGLAAADFAVAVIGHALLEHALDPARLLVGKALAVVADTPAEAMPRALATAAEAIAQGHLLADPAELRPLPLMGLPGWHAQAGQADFLAAAPCFQPLRAGRRYPAPLAL